MNNLIHRALLVSGLCLAAGALSSCETKVVEVHHVYHHYYTAEPTPSSAPENYKVVNSYDHDQ